MKLATPIPRWALERGDILRARNMRGTEVRCRSGRLWITEQGNIDDIWLAAGQGHVCTRRGLILIGAEWNSVMELVVQTRHTRMFDLWFEIETIHAQ